MSLLFVLVALARFEGAALVAVILFELLRRKESPKWYAYLPAVVLLAVYLALNYHWYGNLLPNSAAAKISHGFSGYWGRWPTAFLHATLINLEDPFLRTFYIVLAAYYYIPGARRLKGTEFSRIVLPALGIMLAFYILLNIPGYRWYSAPFIYFGLIYATAGVPATRVGAWCLTIVLAAQFITNSIWLTKSTAEGEDIGGRNNYIELGRWLARNTSPNASIEAVETGTIAYYSNRRIIDIVGLTTPKNAVHIQHRDSRSWFAEDDPDYIVIHTRPYIWEMVAAPSDKYSRVPVDFGIVYLLKRK